MKKTFVKLSALALILCLTLSMVACTTQKKPAPIATRIPASSPATTPITTQSPEVKPISVMALKGPTGMGMAYLMENNSTDYAITLTSTPDDIVSAFASKSVDIAAVPINLASTLYNKLKGNVEVLAINTLGVLYILEKGNTIKSISDLSGKTLYATGQGSTPEYILQYILEKNKVKDVTIKYKTEHSELATLMASGKIVLGMLPEPNVTAVTLKSKDVRIALDLTAEWKKISDTELAQGCIIARKDYVETNAAAVDKFLTDYNASTTFINTNIPDASALIEKYEIMASAEAAAKAIPNCHIVCMRGSEMKKVAGAMFKILFDIQPKSIGGKIPSDDIYYLGAIS